MNAAGIPDWDEVKALVLESYGLIAPKKTLAKLKVGRAKRGTAKEVTRKRRLGNGAPGLGTRPGASHLK
jgi:hypothetical protein